MRQERERKRDEISENRRQIGSRSHDRSSSFDDLWMNRIGSDGSDTTGKNGIYKSGDHGWAYVCAQNELFFHIDASGSQQRYYPGDL